MFPTASIARSDRKRKRPNDEFLETTRQPKKLHVSPPSTTTIDHSSSPSLLRLNSGSEAPTNLTGLAPSTKSSPEQTTKLDPHLVLKTLLVHNQSPTLHQRLTEEAKDNLSPAEADDLLKLLGKMRFAVRSAELLVLDNTECHCIRCHETYIERDNAGSVCCIEHEVFYKEPERWGGDMFRYTCESCGEVGMEDGAGNGIDWPSGGICYAGEHTTDVKDVSYDNDNILSCEANGCPVLHCVRCHGTYLEIHNTGSCYIEHDIFNGEPEHCGADVYCYTCKSCGQVGRKDGSGIDWLSAVCYEGKHTTNVEDVKYDGDNTLTCTVNGCSKLRVRAYKYRG